MKTKHLNKVRDMSGYRIGVGSAGRSNGNNVERRGIAAPVMTGYMDVGKACDRWLRENDPTYRLQRDRVESQEASRMERRRQDAERRQA